MEGKKLKNRAVLIIPWYGKLPAYLGVFLKSLAGKHIDVLWISDADVGEHPSNFFFLRKTLEDVKSLLASRLQTRIVIDTNLRLSDFKPMFGKVFEEYIREYDYWGWGDCDLIYGRKFNEFLERTLESGVYDIISMRKDYLTGPVCFLRNNQRMRNLYMSATNWRENCALSGDIRMLFDECGGEFHNQLMSCEMTMEDCSRIHDSMSAVVWRTHDLKVYKHDVINESALKNGETIKMENDVLTMDGKEIYVFHYVLAKCRRWFFCPNVPYGKVGLYRIARTGFYFGDFAWATRHFRIPVRYVRAIIKLFKRRGLFYMLRRVNRIPYELAK